jgi:uncharacterized protein (TIGR00730 family)
MPMIRNVTVYCSSSSQIAPVYNTAAAELGRRIAQRGWGLVYGGNRVGLMGILSDACRAAGGKVVGITPQWFIDKGIGDDRADELIVSSGMRDRKEMMENRGDALLALPGGLGTLEEIFEVIVARQLGRHDKPIVILNIAHYYDPLLEMIRHGIEHRFIKPAANQLYFVADSVDSAIAHLSQEAPKIPTSGDLFSSASE